MELVMCRSSKMNKISTFFCRSEYYEFCMDEKLGTHLNAPSMYQHREGTMTAEALPLSMLVRAQGR